MRKLRVTHIPTCSMIAHPLWALTGVTSIDLSVTRGTTQRYREGEIDCEVRVVREH